MGRTVLADSRIQTYVEKLYQTNTWYLGLVIGKLTSQKDIAIHLVRTPEPVEDQASDDDEPENSEAETEERKRVPSKPASLDAMNEQWAATHAKQVTTMLPGGVSVIGIFAVAPPNMMKTSEAKLRQVLFAIQKIQKKSQADSLSDSTSDRYLLQICSTTKKFTCRTIDVQDMKSTFRPAEWKSTSMSEKWNRLGTNLGLHLPIYISQKSRTSLSKQIQTGLHPFCRRIENGLTLIEGSLRQGTETLDQSTEKKGKGRDKVQSAQQSYSCSLLVKMSDVSAHTDPTVTECTVLLLRGTIHGRSYVTGKATVEEAENALKADIIRSVTSRCELLCDDLQMVEEDAEKQEVYTTPRRVFFKLPDTSVEFCDYMFQDEKPQEVISRIQELLDITLEESDLDLSCEHAPTEDDFSQLEETDQKEDVKQIVDDTGAGFNYKIVAGVGSVLAFLAAGLSYLLIEQT